MAQKTEPQKLIRAALKARQKAVAPYSKFLVVQIRHGTHESMFSGRREDRLRPEGGQWKIARRKVYPARVA